MPNYLINENSPYLLQHANNPVDWYPWGTEALEKARKEDKPIFLSIGYAACHWCHVMAHESFEDPATAALMNEHFINIKVDREERPDLDSIYMQAVVAMTGQGGWPMSVFITPEGQPLFGGTYFPPRQRFNLPCFRDVLLSVARVWQEDRAKVLASSQNIIDGKLIEGQLGLKGTIDLITEIHPGFYEIVDWKTGRRLNWATGKEKTYESLCKDPQLRIYHYSASMIYPEIDDIMITIYFINDGGPFTVSFSKKDLQATKDMLQSKFERIKATQIPRLSKTWKCQKFCYFGKNSFENPMIETRGGQFTKKGEPMTMCQQIDYVVKTKGMDHAIKHYTKEGHKVADYKAPGQVEK